MHELSLARAILSCAVRHAGGRPVTAVHVRAGGLRQVVPASLEFHWSAITRGTLCEHAVLEIEPVPARASCPACGHQWQLEEPRLLCPRCGGAAVVASGEELLVESIEVEEVASACTAPR